MKAPTERIPGESALRGEVYSYSKANLSAATGGPFVLVTDGSRAIILKFAAFYIN